MTGIKPTFSSGSRIRIKMNGKTIAHAQGLTFGFSVIVDPIYVMGEYGPVTAVVSGYSGVQDSLQIVNLMPKVARDAIQGLVEAGKADIAELTATGVVGPELTTQVANGGRSVIDSTQTITNPLDEAKYHLDPERVLLSQTFDLQIYMRYATTDGKYAEFLQWEVKDCRLTGRSIGINPGSPVGADFQYQGLLLTHPARPGNVIEKNELVRDTNG